MVLPDERPVHAERRAQFLNVAKKVFAQNGFQPTTMDDIAREAGFTKPILYQYFESKATLYQEIVASTGAVLINDLMAAVATKELPREKIEVAFQVYFNMVVNDTEAFRILFIHAHDGETAAELRTVELGFVSFLVPYIDSSIGHDGRRQMAAGIVGLAEGAATIWLMQQEAKGWPTPAPDTAQRLAENSATLAWGGLRALLRD
jgi:AcrR family transcriptional regulator